MTTSDVQKRLAMLRNDLRNVPVERWSRIAMWYNRHGWEFHVHEETATLFAYRYNSRRVGERRHSYAFLPDTPQGHQHQAKDDHYETFIICK